MKKTRKRAYALLSLILIAAIALAGCGKKDESAYALDADNPVALTIWHYYNGAQKLAFDQAVAEFNETTGYEKGIVVEAYSQGNVIELLDKVVASAEKEVGAEELPDIFAAYVDTAYTVDQLGLCADLDQYLSAEDLAGYMESYIEEGRIDAENHLKIFPVAKATEIMMLNKTDWDKFAAATGSTLEELATVEGVTAAAEKYYNWTDALTPEADDGKAFFGRDAVANYVIIGNMQLGNEVFQVKGGQVKVSLDEEIYRKLWDNYYAPMVKGYFAAHGRFRSDDAKTGDILALVCSTSGAMYFPSNVIVNDAESYPIEALALPAPVFSGGKPYAVQQGAGMMVLKSTPKQEYAATEFLQWFTDDERNIAFCLQSGYLPVKQSANDWDKITHALAQQAEQQNPDTYKNAMQMAMETIHNDILYTNKPFANGTQARAVLEDHMTNQIKADLAQIEKQMAAGVSRSDAAAPFLTDAHFEECYAQLCDALTMSMAEQQQ